MQSIFLAIFLIDILLMGMFFFIGWYSVEREHKETWGDAKSMEWHESDKRSEEWEDKHKFLNWFQSFYYELRRKKDVPDDTYRNIKYFIQRGKKGYSDRDVWGFYNYLTNVITSGLKDLEKQVHGAPSGFASSHSVDLEGNDPATKEWKKMIGKMIWTFEAIKKVEDHEWVMVPDEKHREEYKKYVRRLNAPDKKRSRLFKDLPPHKWHLMTKKEMKQYHEGWKLFKDYFMDLWD